MKKLINGEKTFKYIVNGFIFLTIHTNDYILKA